MATLRQKRAAAILVEKAGSVSGAMRKVGYSPKTAKDPSKLTKSKGWQELMDQYLPEKLLAEKHKQLLNATDIGHMVFPPSVTDKAITELLATINCVPKKFQHGDMQTHVWFWARDNKAIKDGLDMAYKLRGNYAPEKKQISGGLNLSQLFAGDEPLLEDE